MIDMKIITTHLKELMKGFTTKKITFGLMDQKVKMERRKKMAKR